MKDFKYVFLLFLGWRLILIFISLLGLLIFPTTNTNNSYHNSAKDTIPWEMWANWDGKHYLSIAENGYTLHQTAFFPGYPLTIKAVMFFGVPSFWAGFLISQVAALIFLYLFYKIAQELFPIDQAKHSLFLLLIFPTSFFLVSVYSESLFLALCLAAFYFSLKQKWFLAFFLAGLSSITRNIGIFVIFSIIFQYLFPINFKLPSFSLISKSRFIRITIILFLISILVDASSNILRDSFWQITGSLSTIQPLLTFSMIIGLILSVLEFSYKFSDRSKLFSFKFIFYLVLSFLPFWFWMLYLYFYFQDPLSFINQERNWNKVLTLPTTTIWSYTAHLLSTDFSVIGPAIRTCLEYGLVALFIVLQVLFWRTLPLFLNLYSGFCLITFLASGILVGMPRYLLTVFPIFLIMGQIKNEYYQKFWLLFSSLALAISLAAFINNYWIS